VIRPTQDAYRRAAYSRAVEILNGLVDGSGDLIAADALGSVSFLCAKE
jgi:hypothetical protein